jgi:MoaA/NifB/PqqE/SkfB family radical SAM enzyme
MTYLYTTTTYMFYKYLVLKLPDITRLHIELTTRCNARCPMCPRNYRGLDYNSGYPLCELSLQDLQKIASPQLLFQMATARDPFRQAGVNFNGNLGDFASAREAQEIALWFAQESVPVYINTNGSVRNAAWWAGLAHPKIIIGFALDGLADTHHRYRQDTDWNRIINNAQAFIAAGGQAVWRFILFDHNRHQVEACRTLAQDLGFARFEIINDGRDRSAVYTRQGDFSHWVGPEEPTAPDLAAQLHNHKTWFRIETVRPPQDTPDAKINCQHQQQGELYIAADGTVWPCCFLGFYPGQMQHPGNEQLLPLVHENNALEHDLAHCLEWFDAVERTWALPSVQQGRLYQCVSNCARS